VRIERLAKAPKEPQDKTRPGSIRADDRELPPVQVSETEETRSQLSFLTRVAIVMSILVITLGFFFLMKYGRRKKVQ
jgi:heme/copper-type cytochrome/quinol oxidase subunit 2